MKFLKCISLFCIFTIALVALFICVYRYFDHYFYPGKQTNIEKDIQKPNVIHADSQDNETSCDTIYLVCEYDEIMNREFEYYEEIPYYFMGLNREEMMTELSEYNKNPSFQDKEKGFRKIELLSFSAKEIRVRKTYKREEKEEEYYLKVENNKIVVYLRDMETVFIYTDILLSDMPDDLQQDIIHVKCINNLEDLYDFLESYSS